MALQEHRRQGGSVEGSWQEADRVVRQAVRDARAFQNADGSFSTNYFSRPGTTPDLAQALSTTGHVLEFLVLASSDEELNEPYLQRAVLHLCDLFRKTEAISLECGALYHALHGLVLYRERVFGPLSLPNSA
jgi:hypothetical protein